MNQDHIQKMDEYWMHRALRLARFAARLDEVPVGAVLVKDNQMVSAGCNLPIYTHDPSAHAEIVALRRAARRLKNYRLPGCTLYVTLEPCMMCVGAITHARIDRLVYAASEPKAGAVASRARLLDLDFLNHRIECTKLLLEDQSKALIQQFFARRRAQKRAERNLLQQES